MKPIPITMFGKDHFSLLALIEILCVDFQGLVSDTHRRSFRVNLTRHPGYGYFPMGVNGHEWKSSYGTRLKGYSIQSDMPAIFKKKAIDRDDVILPEILIKDFREDIKTIMEPFIDILWNAAGYPRNMTKDN